MSGSLPCLSHLLCIVCELREERRQGWQERVLHDFFATVLERVNGESWNRGLGIAEQENHKCFF